MHHCLPLSLRAWVEDQAKSMGLPGPDDYVLLLLRLEKQCQDMHGIEDRYRQVFRSP